MIAVKQLIGKDESALVAVGPHCLHRDVVNDWLALQQAASLQGFDLTIASAYRSFNRQLAIWNDKVADRRPVLDAQGCVLDISGMTDEALLFAILQWSALPGGSRHHWGTDIDIYDRAAVPDSYVVQLTEEESAGNGVFSGLHQWLDECIECSEAHGFYRPYTASALNNKVAPERWHLSHWQTSQTFSCELSAERLYQVLEQQQDLALLDTILANFDEIFTQYIRI